MHSYKNLYFNLLKKEIEGKYKGTLLGVFWPLLNPLLTLSIFYFVFGEIFQVKWSGNAENKVDFALLMFLGLLLFNFFAEIVNQAPSVISSNANFVKKVIFPLEILMIVNVGAAGFTLIIAIFIWLIMFAVFAGDIKWTIIYLPLILIPLMAFCLGAAFVLAAIGAYIKDMGQTIGLVTTATMFLSPIFYPLDALPENFQNYLLFNPLTIPIESIRKISYFGKMPDLQLMLFYSFVAFMVLWAGIRVFQRAREGFADVV